MQGRLDSDVLGPIDVGGKQVDLPEGCRRGRRPERAHVGEPLVACPDQKEFRVVCDQPEKLAPVQAALGLVRHLLPRPCLVAAQLLLQRAQVDPEVGLAQLFFLLGG